MTLQLALRRVVLAGVIGVIASTLAGYALLAVLGRALSDEPS